MSDLGWKLRQPTYYSSKLPYETLGNSIDGSIRKLLTRNTHAHRRDGKSKEGDIYSKADIMNLISSDTQSMAEIAFTFLGLFKIQLNMLLGFAFIWYLLGEF